jgi:glycosyltransferase involved in cell wall biosynthesis
MSHPPLSILYLIDNCGHGGAEAQIALQASQVAALGHSVMVAAPGSGWLTQELGRRGIAAHPLSTRSGKLAWVYWAREITRLVRAHGSDVIQAYLFQMNLCGALAGKLTGTPVVASVRGRAYDFDRRRRLAAYHFIARWGATFTTPSCDLRQALLRAARIPPERVIAIHNGVDLERLEQCLAQPDATGLPAGFRVATVGRLESVKGLEYFLAAAAIIAPRAPDMRFILAGDGPLRARLERQAHELKLADRVTFLGYRDNIAAVLPCLDVYVQPSLSEGLSNALLEAMAAGRPIVATDIGANAEAVRDRHSALLVPAADARALADAVFELYRDRALAAALGRAARARARADFSLARAAERYVALYRVLAAGGDAAAASHAAATEPAVLEQP